LYKYTRYEEQHTHTKKAIEIAVMEAMETNLIFYFNTILGQLGSNSSSRAAEVNSRTN